MSKQQIWIDIRERVDEKRKDWEKEKRQELQLKR